jgi:hypothetical protein
LAVMARGHLAMRKAHGPSSRVCPVTTSPARRGRTAGFLPDQCVGATMYCPAGVPTRSVSANA